MDINDASLCLFEIVLAGTLAVTCLDFDLGCSKCWNHLGKSASNKPAGLRLFQSLLAFFLAFMAHSFNLQGIRIFGYSWILQIHCWAVLRAVGQNHIHGCSSFFRKSRDA